MTVKNLKERIDARVESVRQEAVQAREEDRAANEALVEAKPDALDPKTYGAREVRVSRNGNLIVTY